nr:putative DNA-directed DNA polymerase [Oedogonium sp. 244]
MERSGINKFKIDLTRSLTIGSLSFTIYQSNFNNDPIKRLKQTQDNFIRQAYLGGRCEVFKPRGYNLYAYDVNSLYPYVMTLPMPINNIQWNRDLSNKKLTEILEYKIGFIKADIIAPTNMYYPILRPQPINGKQYIILQKIYSKLSINLLKIHLHRYLNLMFLLT